MCQHIRVSAMSLYSGPTLQMDALFIDNHKSSECYCVACTRSVFLTTTMCPGAINK